MGRGWQRRTCRSFLGGRQEGLNFLPFMEVGTATGDHDVPYIDSGENLDILRRLNAGVQLSCLHIAGVVNHKEPLAVSRSINSLGWNRSSIHGLRCAQLYLRVHTGD